MDIAEVLKERIMVMDGAMGTMLQTKRLEEEDFRGEESSDVIYKASDITCTSQPGVETL